MADQLGRKMTIAIGSILFAAGALLSAAALDFWVLLIGRLITGVGVGFAFVIAPLYTSETSPSRYRGVLTSLTEFFIDCGILLGVSLAVGKVALSVSQRIPLSQHPYPAASGRPHVSPLRSDE